MSNLVKIPIERIVKGKYQTRKKFPREQMEELAYSIHNNTLLQPIIVRISKEEEGMFEIISGERRFRAVRALGHKEIDAIIKNYDDRSTVRLTLLENLQRQDLNPIEEALGFKQVKEEMELTQEKLSKVVNKSRPYIANSLRLLELPEEVIDMLKKREITSSFARTLLSLKDNEIIIDWAKDESKQLMSVNELEKAIKKYLTPKEEKDKPQQDMKLLDYELDFENNLNSYLTDSKVKVSKTKKETYKVQIEIKDEEQLKQFIKLTSKRDKKWKKRKKQLESHTTDQ